MRATPGAQVTLFDGRGDECSAAVERVGRVEVALAILARQTIERELSFRLTLGVALPKGDRQKWLVEKAVELGVTRIVPLRTQRGVAQPVDRAILRLERAVIEASKQCGRNRLMRIDQPRSWADFVPDAADASCRLMAHPGGEASLSSLVGDLTGNICLAVGPEGGFTDDEVALRLAPAGGTVDLGPRVLRVETAALLLAAIVGTAVSRDPMVEAPGANR